MGSANRRRTQEAATRRAILNDLPAPSATRADVFSDDDLSQAYRYLGDKSERLLLIECLETRATLTFDQIAAELGEPLARLQRDVAGLRALLERRRATEPCIGCGSWDCANACDFALLAADDGCCWLCGWEIDLSLVYPHPLSWTRDHVIPTSKRGGDHRGNYRLAHKECNEARGDGREGITWLGALEPPKRVDDPRPDALAAPAPGGVRRATRGAPIVMARQARA